MKCNTSKSLLRLRVAMIALITSACSSKQVALYEFDELYTGPDDTYITDYVPSTQSPPNNAQENLSEDDYVTHADRNSSASSWSQNGWGNSGFGGYNYGAYNPDPFNASMMWMPYWAYSPAGFYNSPYAYYGYGMGYGMGYGNFGNPYFSPYGYGFWGNWDHSTSQIIHGSRQPIASNTGNSSSYAGGRFYLGQNRQATLQKPKPIMNTPKPDERIPSGRIQQNISRAYKADRNSGSPDRNRSINDPGNSKPKPPSTRPQREVKPSDTDRNERPSRMNDRNPISPTRPSPPARPSSPGKIGRPK